MHKYLLFISLIMVSQNAIAQNTWVELKDGITINNLTLKGDTIIAVGYDETDKMLAFLTIHYCNLSNGKSIKKDTFIYSPIQDSGVVYENYIAYNDCLGYINDDLQIGFNYIDSAGSWPKWQAGLLSASTLELNKHNLNVDTFSTVFSGIYNIAGKDYILVNWKDPDEPGCGTPNFKLIVNKNQTYQTILTIKNGPCTPNGGRSYIRNLLEDNQSDSTFFIMNEQAWNFRGVPMQYESFIWKMDTSGKKLWSAKLNYTDSLNMLGTPFVQKNNGNLLALWNTWEYRPYKSPKYSVITAQRNDSCTLVLAEVDYETGKVIKRKNYRKYLNKHMAKGGYDPKFKEKQYFFLTDAIKVGNGVVWAGYRSYTQSKQPWNLFMPFLFKTDFNSKPMWYRDYIVFPNDDEDRGMEVNSFVRTPDGGFVLVGENLDYSRNDVQRSILVKVDSFGCLIPGCQLKDNINEVGIKKCELYPNPTTSSFTIALPNKNDAWTYQIFDYTGKILGYGLFDQEQNQISTQTLPNGIYQIILQNPKTSYNENHSFIIAR